MSGYRPDVNGEAVQTCLSCPWSPKYDELAHQLDRVIAERDAVQQQLTRTLAEKASIAKKFEALLRDTDLAEPAEEVYAYWKDVIGDGSRRLKFSAKRAKAVQARLNEGWTVDDLKRAVDGAKIGAYVDERGVKHDDLELICRDAPKVRRFVAIADADEQRRRRENDQLLAALAFLFGETNYRIPNTPGVQLWPCPVCGDLEHPHDSPMTVGITADGHAHCWACQRERHHLIVEADRLIRIKALGA